MSFYKITADNQIEIEVTGDTEYCMVTLTIADVIKMFSKDGFYVKEINETVRLNPNDSEWKTYNRKERVKRGEEVRKECMHLATGGSMGQVSLCKKNGKWVPGDGGHRLRAIYKFIVQGLKVLPNDDFFMFGSLTDKSKERILHSQISFEFNTGSDCDIRKIFKAKNSGKAVNGIEDFHEDYAETKTWQTCEEMSFFTRKEATLKSFVNSHTKTGGKDEDNGYKRTLSILQMLGGIYRTITNGSSASFNKKADVKLLLTAENKDALKKTFKVFKEISSVLLRGNTISAFFSATTRNAHSKTHLYNLVVALAYSTCDMTDKERKAYLKKFADTSVANELAIALGTNDKEHSKYFMSCGGSNGHVNEQIEAVCEALNEVVSK